LAIGRNFLISDNAAALVMREHALLNVIFHPHHSTSCDTEGAI
jgi:hypothetical protein